MPLDPGDGGYQSEGDSLHGVQLYHVDGTVSGSRGSGLTSSWSPLLTRYPWVSSAVMMLLGAAILLVVWFGTIVEIFRSAFFPFLLFAVALLLLILGVINLLIALVASLNRALRNRVRPSPALAILQSAPSFRPGYEQGKADMAKLLVEELGITPAEARTRVDRLEQRGQIIFGPDERWVIPRC